MIKKGQIKSKTKHLVEVAQMIGCSEIDLIFIETIVNRSKTSFASGMKILSPERRYGMYALYSFCRIVDDIADEEGEISTKHRLLQDWRNRIDALYNNEKPQGSIELVLQSYIKHFHLDQNDFVAIIDGMEMDIDHPIVAPDEATLDIYCDRVASAVGRLAVRIFGDSSDNADQVAYHLGRALQLTNILRDLGEDAGRGRLYLPKDLLERFHLPLTPHACISDPKINEVCKIVSFRALDHFRIAKEYIAKCDRKALRPAKIMATTYAYLLVKQSRIGWKYPMRRASLSLPEKVMVGILGLMV